MKKNVLSCLLIALFLLAGTHQAQAALKSSNQPVAKEDAYNPNQNNDDIILPMPNDMNMVLRLVPVRTKGLLDDKNFEIGLKNPKPERELLDRQITAFIAAPFLRSNFPAEWQAKKLPEKMSAQDAKEKDKYTYYMIGKYELTNGQWAAIMGGDIDDDGHAEQPKTNISWYDMQEFLRKYNEWLMEHHADKLPKIDNVPAYLRLPTEAEWEYAAKSGNPRENDTNDESVDFPGLPDGERIENFAVFNMNDGKLPIGKRQPNTLGIYDMAGNVAELVQSGFRFPVMQEVEGGGRYMRQHGSEGSLLTKGGSFLSGDKTDVYPGKREEIRMFEKGSDNIYHPFKSNSVGMRVVLGSPNNPGMARSKMLLEAEKDTEHSPLENATAAPDSSAKTKTSSDGIVVINLTGDPVRELDKITAATQSPQTRDNLNQFRELIKAQNAAFNRERDKNLLEIVRGAAYKADNLNNIAFRCYQLDHDAQRIKKLSEGRLPPDFEKNVQQQMQRHFRNLKVSTNLYRESVEDAAKYPKAAIDEKVQQLHDEYAGNNQLNKVFRSNLDIFAKHVDFVRKNGINKLDNLVLWKNILSHNDMYTVVSSLEKSSKSQKKGR